MRSISKLVVTKPLLGMMNALLLALSLCASFAWADNLESLRASGAIGESHTGYVFARDPAVRAEADAINAKRKIIYQESKVYAEEIFKKVPAGTWIQINGQWIKK